MSVEAPDEVTPENIDELSEEEIEAYNEQVEAELEAQLDEQADDLDDTEQAAAEALLQDAEETVETETVALDSGLELEVRTRIPPAVERMQSRLERMEKRGASPAEIATLNCEMLAEMVETEGYGSPEPWHIAYQGDDGGLQWLSEVTSTVLEPAHDRAEATKGKFER